MLRLITTISICLFLGTTTSLAGNRTEREMLSIAQRQLQSQSNTHRAPANAEIVKLMEKDSYNIYGSDDVGFVVVSRDDRRMAVLGYSQSKFEIDQLPCGMKWWLDAISSVDNDEVCGLSRRVGYVFVAPLLKTLWSQSDPFNFLTPEIESKHAPTGCVATALSQIMKYYGYPSAGKGQGYYTIGDNTTRVYEPVAYTYDWDKMLNSYVGVTLTDEIRMPIAKLLKDAGSASCMNYGKDASGTQTQYAANGMVENFSYDPYALHCYIRAYHDDAEWMAIIYDELASGNPVLYGGSDAASGGHSFVLDGVDTEGRIHVNWGWAGKGDGFFDFADLNPTTNFTTYHFNDHQEMAFGFRPNPEPTVEEEFESLWYLQGEYTITIKSRMMTFSSDAVYNYHFQTFSGSLGVAIESSDGHPENDMYVEVTNATFGDQATFWGLTSLSASKIISIPQAGSYRVYFASKDKRDSKPRAIRNEGGAIGYTMTVDNAGKITLSEEKTPLLPTGIAAPSVTRIASSRFFDLQGREVKTPTRGLYIRNGKKVVVK